MSNICVDYLIRTDRQLTWLTEPTCEKCSLAFTSKSSQLVHRMPFLLACQHLMCGPCVREYAGCDAITCERCSKRTPLPDDAGDLTLAMHPSYYMLGLLERKHQEMENLEHYCARTEVEGERKPSVASERLPAYCSIVPVAANEISSPKKVKNQLEIAFHGYETTKYALEKRIKSYPESYEQVLRKINGHFLQLHNELQMEEARVLQQVRDSFLEQQRHHKRQQQRLEVSRVRLKELYARAKRYLSEPATSAADEQGWRAFQKQVKTFLETDPLKILKRSNHGTVPSFHSEAGSALKQISKSFKLTVPDVGKMVQLVPANCRSETAYHPAGSSFHVHASAKSGSVAESTAVTVEQPNSSDRTGWSSSRDRLTPAVGDRPGSSSSRQSHEQTIASYRSSSSSHRASRVPRKDGDRELKRCFTTVKVTNVVNPHEFYVQDELHLDSTNSMVELCQREAEEYEAELIAGIDPLNVRIGKLYLVRSDRASNWYRALVLDILGTTGSDQRGPYRVQFIDYGGQATVTHEQVRPMSSELATINGRAIRCSLYNVAPIGWKPDDLTATWSDESRLMMMDFVANHKMLMFEVSKHSGTLLVDLFQPPITRGTPDRHSKKEGDMLWEGYYEPMSLRSALVFAKQCILLETRDKRRPEIHDRLKLLEFWLAKARAQAQKRLRLSCAPVLAAYDCFEVLVTHSVSPDQFYLMPLEWKRKEFEALQSALGELCRVEEEEVRSFHPYVGLVCAFALGQVWFRGRIEKLLPDGTVEVFVLDSGERLAVHRYDLFLLPPDCKPLRKHPLAVSCRLEHIHPKRCDDNNYGIVPWTPEALEEFNQIVRSSKLRFSVKMGELCNETQTYGVVLYLHNRNDRDTCINKLLVSNGHAECDEGKEGEISDRMNEATIEATTSGTAPTTGGGADKPPTNDSKAVDPRIMVEMLRIISPSEFYVRSCTRKPDLERFHQRIQQNMVEALDGNDGDGDGEPNGGPSGCNWSVGDVCVVYASVSGNDPAEWYRARVTSVLEDGVQYVVFLIDRAETVTVHRTNTARLTYADSMVQPGALRCRLACVEPVGGSTTWHKSTLDAFVNTIEAYDRHAVSLDAIDPEPTGSLCVVLWGIRQTMPQALAPKRTEYRNINQLLVVRGLAHSTGRFRTFATKGAGAEEEVKRFEDTVAELMRSQYEQLQQFFRTVAAVSADTQDHASGEGRNETAKTKLNYSDVRVDLDDACAAALSLVDEPMDSITCWPASERLDKTVFVGLPTHIANDGTVYMYDVSHEPLLNRMRDRINEQLMNTTTVASERGQFRVGDPCFCRYHLDGLFYRGTILLIIEPYRTYRVLFVDYGNEETCTVQDLRPATACGLVPIQTHRFRLTGILPLGYSEETALWPEEALVVCHGLIVQKACKVRVDTTSVWSDSMEDFTARRNHPIPCELTLLKDSVDVRMALMELNMFRLCSVQSDRARSNGWPVQSIPPRKREVAVSIAPVPSPPPTRSTSVTEQQKIELQRFMEAIQAEYIKEEQDFEDPNEIPDDDNEEYGRLNRAQSIDLELLEDEPPAGDSVPEQDSPLPSPASFISNEFETSSRLSSQERDAETFDMTASGPAECDDPVLKWFPQKPPFRQAPVGFYAEFVNYGDDLTLHVFPHLEGHTRKMDYMHDEVQTVAMSRNRLHRWQASVLEPGAPCLAPYPVDGKYYRAIVEELLEQGDEVRVLYVDYLNRDTVTKKQLRKCPVALRNVPLRNITVRLAGLRPNSRLRIEDVCHRLVELLHSPFYVRVVDYPAKPTLTDVPEVELYTGCDCKTLVYQKMIDTKYFLPKTTAPRK